MLVGVPKEVKDNENRVDSSPSTVRTDPKGHRVLSKQTPARGVSAILINAAGAETAQRAKFLPMPR
jgi:alanine dehydrogenase